MVPFLKKFISASSSPNAVWKITAVSMHQPASSTDTGRMP